MGCLEQRLLSLSHLMSLSHWKEHWLRLSHLMSTSAIVCSTSTVTRHLYRMEWTMAGSRQLGGLLDEQIGEAFSHGAPVGCVLKDTPPGYQKHPFGRNPQLLNTPSTLYPSAVAADTQSATEPTESKPVVHSFVPCVPMVNTAITSHRSMDGWM